MASGKKYYWLKLQRDFFKRHDIRIIEKQTNGKDYIIFYLKLLTESIDHEGRLRFSDNVPYDIEMLSVITDTNVDVCRSAVDAFLVMGLMELWDDGTLYMTKIADMIGSETDWAARKREQRGVKANEKDIVHLLSTDCPDVSKKCPSELEKESEKELEKDKRPVRSRSSGGDYSEDFKTWWETYPKKIGKGGAYDEWKKLKSHMPPIQEHLDKVAEWAKSEKWANENGQYIPNPKTWIKERRWDDELPSKQINKYEGLKTYGRCDKCGKENNLINNVCIDCIKEQNNVA